ncbi:MAG: Fur family transcriptional regulator [Mycobacteriales bacterium]
MTEGARPGEHGWHRELRARGYRLTPQRQLVLEAVTRLGHATPEEIAGEVRTVVTGINISTVYRTLELLEELGLVTHTHLGHGAPTYHAASDAGHVHLVCRRCEQVTEVGPDAFGEIVERLRLEHGFRTDVGHLAVFGLCADCAALPQEQL